MMDLAEYDIAKAEGAMDFIDCLPKRIALILIQGCSQHYLDVKRADANIALGHIGEILGELFYKDRQRLEKIVGWQNEDTSYGEKKLEAMNEVIKGIL